MWQQVLHAASHVELPLAASPPLPRYGEPTTIRPRLGQAGFRLAVLEAYDRSCAVTTEHSLPVLEAAHIRPYGEGGEHSVQNGLLLRSDIHRLFDLGYVTISNDHRFRVSRRLRDDFANGKTYYALANRRLHTPRDRALQPHPDMLEWHAETRFLA